MAGEREDEGKKISEIQNDAGERDEKIQKVRLEGLVLQKRGSGPQRFECKAGNGAGGNSSHPVPHFP